MPLDHPIRNMFSSARKFWERKLLYKYSREFRSISIIGCCSGGGFLWKSVFGIFITSFHTRIKFRWSGMAHQQLRMFVGLFHVIWILMLFTLEVLAAFLILRTEIPWLYIDMIWFWFITQIRKKYLMMLLLFWKSIRNGNRVSKNAALWKTVCGKCCGSAPGFWRIQLLFTHLMERRLRFLLDIRRKFTGTGRKY